MPTYGYSVTERKPTKQDKRKANYLGKMSALFAKVGGGGSNVGVWGGKRK